MKQITPLSNSTTSTFYHLQKWKAIKTAFWNSHSAFSKGRKHTKGRSINTIQGQNPEFEGCTSCTQRCNTEWEEKKRNQRGIKTCLEGGIFTGVQSNSVIECINTYSIVPGLGKQRGERETTVNTRGRESVGGARGETVVGNIVTEEKKEGRPVEFRLNLCVHGKPEGSMTHHVDTRTSV